MVKCHLLKVLKKIFFFIIVLYSMYNNIIVGVRFQYYHLLKNWAYSIIIHVSLGTFFDSKYNLPISSYIDYMI